MNNLEIQQQILQLLEAQNKLLEAQAKLNQNNLSITRSMAEAINKINFKNSTDQLNEMKNAAEKAAESSKKLGSTGSDLEQELVKHLEKAADKAQALSSGFAAAEKRAFKFGLIGAAALDGLTSGFKMTANLITRMGSLLVGSTKFIMNLGKAIITAPFKMLGALLNDTTSGSNELQAAIEEVRKEFGNLREATGKATLDMARSLKGELANTGLSVYRIFGNLAERIKFMLEYAKNLGPLFGVLADQFAKNAEVIGAYYKGLGLTAEGQKAVAARSHAMGKEVTEVLREMANYSLQLGKEFGLSAKEISRDMGNMMNDFTHFGHLAPKTLAQVSVFARKLGIDIKALAGVMDQFANFEDAAKGAAQLSQAFGLNIDAIKLMKAQDPAQKVEMLRKAFFAAGRSVENMTYQERRLLAAQSGVNEESLNLVFSLKNQNLSYAQIQKKGEAARKNQISQAEAMQKLAGAIERLVKSGGGMAANSFFEVWLKGFKSGIRWSKEFRGLMRNLRIDVRNTFIEGMKVGKAFVAAFPGIRDFIGGLRDLFEPRRFRKMLTGTTEAFKKFFNDMAHGKNSMPELLEHLKEHFSNWFDASTPSGKRMLNGFKTFFDAFSKIAGSLLKIALEGVTKGIRGVVDLLTGKTSLSGMAATGKGAGGFIGKLLIPLIDAIKEKGPDLWKAVKELFAVLWVKVKGVLTENAGSIASFLFGPAIIGGIARSVLANAASSLVTTLLSSLGNLLVSGIGSLFSSSGIIGGAFTASLGTLGAIAGGALLAALVGGFIFFPEETQGILDNVLGKFGEFAAKAGEWIGIGAGKVIEFIGNLPGYIATFFQKLPSILQEWGPRIVNGLQTTVTAILVTLPQKLINGLLNGIEAGLTKALPQYSKQIKAVYGVIRSVITGVFDFVKGYISTVFDGFKLVGKVLYTIFEFAYNAVAGTIKGIIDAWNLVSSAVTTSWNFIKDVWGGATTFFSGLFNSVSSGAENIWNGIKDLIKGAWDTISGAWSNSISFYTGIFNGIMEAVKTPLNFVKEKFEEVFGFARNAVNSVSTVVDRIFGNSVHDVVRRDLDQTTPIANRWADNLINAAQKAEAGMTQSSSNIAQATQASLQTVKAPGSQIEVASPTNTGSINSLTESIKGLTALNVELDKISQQKSGMAAPIISKMIEDVNIIGTTLSEKFPQNIRTMTNAFAGINETHVIAATSGITTMAQIMNTISAVNVESMPAANVVRDLVIKVNEISQALTEIKPININAGLRRLAGNLGLGNTDEFTINHKNFNVNITLNVKIDAEDMEKVLIERPNTRFTHQVNTQNR